MSEKVTISLRLGQGIHEVVPKFYEKCAFLDRAKFEADPKLTWVDAINASYGIQLDPAEFFVRRKCFGKTHSRYEITQPIEQLLRENYTGKWSDNFSRERSVCLISKKNNRTRAISTVKGNAMIPKPLASFCVKKNKGTTSTPTANGGVEPIPPSSASPSSVVPSRVSFVLKTLAGLNKKYGKACPELIPLDDQLLIDVDVNLTWSQVLRQRFKVELDRTRYYIRRHRTITPLLVKPEHDLMDKVSLLAQEFVQKKGKASVILLVDRQAPHPLPRYLDLLQLQHTVSQPILTQPTPDIVQDAQNISPKGRPTLKRKLPIQNDHHPSPQKTSPKNTIQNGSPSRTGRGQVEDDSMSTTSFRSQQSSQVDLEEEGIDFEEIRNEVYEAAVKLTNKQLVLARRDMLKLKDNSRKAGHRDRFTEWTTTCPLPAAILREILGV